jgi:hypothetical protein
MQRLKEWQGMVNLLFSFFYLAGAGNNPVRKGIFKEKEKRR